MDFDVSNESVRTLDRSNFFSTVRTEGFAVVVNFYRGCANSDKFALEYEKAADILSSHGRFVFAKVEVRKKLKVLAKLYGAWSFPTIKIFEDGGKKVQDYNGPRDSKGIVECLTRLIGPTAYRFPLDNINLSPNPLVVVGVFPKFSGQEYDNFIKASKKLKWGYDFHVTSTHPFSSEESSIDPVVYVCSNYPREFVETTIFNVDALVKFVKDNSIPDVTFYNEHPQRVAKFLYSSLYNAKAMLFINSESGDAAAFLRKYSEVATEHRGHGINFMLGDVVDSQDAFRLFELHKSRVPIIVIKTASGEKYVKVNLTPSDIAPWVEEYKAGNLSSEQIRSGNDGPVKDVANNFQEMVTDSGKNVLLELGPWCQCCEHCKKLTPILNDVAVFFENEADVVIAKLYKNSHDIRSKEYDTPDVKDRPTLYFKRSSEEKFKLYHGLRTKENIIEFIQKNRDVAYRYKPAEIKSGVDAINLIGDKEIVIVGVFPKFSGQEYGNFIKVAKNLKSCYDFCLTSDAKHLPRGDPTVNGPVVRLFKPFDERFVDTKIFDVYALGKFVKDASTPDVTLYNDHPPHLVDNFFDRRNNKAMLFINRNGEGAVALESKYLEIARKYKGQDINFMLGDLEDSEPAFQYFNLEKSMQPLLVIMNSMRQIYLKEYLKHDENIEAWVKDYKAGFHVDALVKYVAERNITVGENGKAMLFINRRAEGADVLESKYLEVAKKYEGDCISCIFMDLEESEHAFRQLDLEESQNSLIVIVNPNKEIYMKADLKHDDDIEAWVKDCKAGKVAKYRKSRATPGVRRIRDFNFERDFLDNEKNVLLVLYDSKYANFLKLIRVLDDVAFHFGKIKGDDDDDYWKRDAMRKDVDFHVALMDHSHVNDYDSTIRHELAPILHHLKTLYPRDGPTVYFKTTNGRIETYEGDIIGKNIIDFINTKYKKKLKNTDLLGAPINFDHTK